MSPDGILENPEPRKEADRYWQTRLARFKDVRITASAIGKIGTGDLNALEDEIQAMKAAMCAVYTYRNALLPIARLPSEVLAIIFSFAVINEPPTWKKTSSLSTSKESLGWIKVSHVSHDWRQTALECPSLWRTIFFQPDDKESRWPLEMLARSKSTLLNIALPEGSANTMCELEPKVLESIFAHVAQVEHLYIGHALQCLGLVEGLLARPAPCLKTLDIRSPIIRLGERSPMSTLLPPVLFKKEASKLHSVKILGCHIYHWPAFQFSSITHLEVGLPKLSSTDVPDVVMVFDAEDTLVKQTRPPSRTQPDSCDDFLNFLRMMPQLEYLSLSNTIPPVDPTDAAPQIIPLPNLRKLAIEDKYANICARVLARVQIPVTCTIYVGCGHEDFDGLEDYDDILPSFFAHVGKRVGVSPPLRTLSISDRQGLDIKVWEDWNDVTITKPSPDFEPSSAPTLHLSFCTTLDLEEEEDPDERFEALGLICRLLPLDDLRVIIVGDCRETNWTPASWVDLFSRCKDVRHIRVTDDAALHLLSRLGEETTVSSQVMTMTLRSDGQKSTPDPVDPTPLFPHIQSLLVAYSDLDLPHRSDDGKVGPQNYAECLQAWVATRYRKAGAGPRILRFDCCTGLDADYVKEYRKHVPVVIWDKKKKRRRPADTGASVRPIK